MNVSSTTRFTGIAFFGCPTAAYLLLIGLFSFVTSHSRAQSFNNNFGIDFTREGAWRYTHLPETNHQRNGRVIQDLLTGIGKRLAQLSIVDPPAYSGLQGELQGYLQELANRQADYGDVSLYQTVLLRLNKLDEQISIALSEGRWLAMNGAETTNNLDEQTLIGHDVITRPYALLFRRADYRSKLVHLVMRGEWVKIIDIQRDYYHVQCGLHKGYLGKGMVSGLLP